MAPRQCCRSNGQGKVAVELKSAHWVGNGLYEVSVAGTSYHRTAIQELAKNTPGVPALVLCHAELVPVANNPHDPLAVAVRIAGAVVGHLGRQLAPNVRRALELEGLARQTTTVEAAISNGRTTADRSYEYTVELDLAPDDYGISTDRRTAFPQLTRLPRYPELVANDDGSFTARVWLPVSTHDWLHKRRSVTRWTTDEWDTVNFYADNHKGIGLGHKVLEIPKQRYQATFGDAELGASLEDLDGRWATLRLRARAGAARRP